MTIQAQENTLTPALTQEKVQPDAALSQQNVDPKLNQDPKTTEPAPTEKHEDPDWRAFREARKKDRAEREAAEKRAAEKEAEVAALKAAMEAAFAKNPIAQQPQQAIYPDYQPEKTEEQKIDERVNAILAAREKQNREEQEKREQQEYPQRLTQSYPDFNHIISQENLDYLDYHFPEVSRPLQRLPNGFDKWSDIYHAVKKFVPNNSTVKKDVIKAEINQQKPKSISSPGITQSGQAMASWQDIEARRAANWERMQRVLKGIN